MNYKILINFYQQVKFKKVKENHLKKIYKHQQLKKKKKEVKKKY